MNHCKQCGTELPDGAKFCLQCGTAFTPPVAFKRVEPPKELDFAQPALAGGMFLGLLSSLPLISAGNCVCCMWVLGGGGIAVYLLTKQRPAGISYGDGAFVGVMSGAFGAVVATLVNIPLRILMSSFFLSQQETMEKTLSEYPDFQGPMRDVFMRLVSPELSALTITFTFFMHLVWFSLFAMIGGILTVAILQKQRTRITQI